MLGTESTLKKPNQTIADSLKKKEEIKLVPVWKDIVLLVCE